MGISMKTKGVVMESLRNLESYLVKECSDDFDPNGTQNNLEIVRSMINVLDRSAHDRPMISGIEEAGESVAVMFSSAINSNKDFALPLLLKHAKEFTKELTAFKLQGAFAPPEDMEVLNGNGIRILKEFGL